MRCAPEAVAAALVAAIVGCAGCADVSSTRDVRVTIVDETGAPLPGAVFYAEVADDAGPFAFETRIAGRAGEVPDSAYEPLKLPWRRGARVTFAAFAPGRQAAVVPIPGAHPRTDGVVLTLPAAGSAWNPDLATLAFPFEEAPDLAARLRSGPFAELTDAFRKAWAARPDDAPEASERELRKLADLGLR